MNNHGYLTKRLTNLESITWLLGLMIAICWHKICFYHIKTHNPANPSKSVLLALLLVIQNSIEDFFTATISQMLILSLEHSSYWSWCELHTSIKDICHKSWLSKDKDLHDLQLWVIYYRRLIKLNILTYSNLGLWVIY